MPTLPPTPPLPPPPSHLPLPLLPEEFRLCRGRVEKVAKALLPSQYGWVSLLEPITTLGFIQYLDVDQSQLWDFSSLKWLISRSLPITTLEIIKTSVLFPALDFCNM